MSNVNGMAKNITILLNRVRYGIVNEVLEFCDHVNPDIPKIDRPEFCTRCKYNHLCRTINEQIDELSNIDFLINKEI